MHTYRLHYARTDKTLLLQLNDQEKEYLTTCLEADRQWFILAEQAVNLHQVTLIEAE